MLNSSAYLAQQLLVYVQEELAADEAHVFEVRRVLEAERADVTAGAVALTEATHQAQVGNPPGAFVTGTCSTTSQGIFLVLAEYALNAKNGEKNLYEYI